MTGTAGMISAILFAQWAAIRNSRLGALVRGGIWSLITNLVWYGFWITVGSPGTELEFAL